MLKYIGTSIRWCQESSKISQECVFFFSFIDTCKLKTINFLIFYIPATREFFDLYEILETFQNTLTIWVQWQRGS